MRLIAVLKGWAQLVVDVDTALTAAECGEGADASRQLESVVRRAEMWAVSVLDEFWDGEFPVNPHEIAQRLGIEVYFGDGEIFSRDVSGVIVKLSGEDPAMYVNEEASLGRVRFTIAHEIGHFVEYLQGSSKGLEDEFGYIDLVANRIPTENGLPDHRPEEVFADAFAHGLLMPDWQVKKFVGLGYSLKEVATYFGVSVTTIKNRLAALRLAL